MRATSEAEGDTAEVVVRTDSEAITVFDATDGEATDGWVTAETDARAFSGDDVEVVVRTEGNATIEVDYVSVMIDSTDDGIPDAVESMDLRMPVGPPGVVGTPLNLNPYMADTSGDGLPDADQIDVAWEITGTDDGWQVEAEVLHASAHPGRFDTDGDGLSDYQELREVGTDPMAVDTSGDGFSDLVDPKPTQDSSPIEMIVEMNAEGQVVVQASGPARLDEVAARGYYTFPEDSAGWTQWKLVETDLEQVEGSWVRTAIFEPHLAEDMIPPAAVQFNVSDARGQSQSIRLAAAAYSESGGQSLELNAVDDDGLLDGFIDWVTGDAKLFVATLFVASTVTVPAGGTLGIAVNPKVLAGIGLVIAIGAAVKYYDDLPNPDWVVEEFAKTTMLAAPLTGDPVATFPAAETDPQIDYPVTLPPGADYGNGRGFGWEIVKRTPGITEPSDVGEILRAPSAIEQNGPYKTIIGETGEGNKVVLRLYGGVVLSARSVLEEYKPQGFDNDNVPINEYVELWDDDWGHIRDQLDREHLNRDEIRTVIENADNIYTNGRDYLFVAVINGVVKVVKVTDKSQIPNAPGNGLEVTTAFKPDDGWQYVQRYIQQKGMNQIYPP